MDMALKPKGSGKLERSEHSILRSKEGRPVGSAINDVQKALIFLNKKMADGLSKEVIAMAEFILLNLMEAK
jgi:hypothetical protein